MKCEGIKTNPTCHVNYFSAGHLHTLIVTKKIAFFRDQHCDCGISCQPLIYHQITASNNEIVFIYFLFYFIYSVCY